jgi:hypothetical protein
MVDLKYKNKYYHTQLKRINVIKVKHDQSNNKFIQ